MKRGRYHQSRQEFNITLDFLNKEHKLLTKREFSCLLNSDYESYKQLFLKNKITSFYGNNHDINWFIDHYINKKEIDYTSKIDAFNSFDLQNISLDNNIDLKMFNYHSKNIIMEIWKTHDIEELTEMLKGIKGFLDISTYYTHDKGKFTYIAIISVDDDTDYEEFSSSIRKLTDVILHIQPFVPNKITYNSSDLSLMQIDKENAYKLIKIYLKRYNINYEIPDASADWYILFLRYVFNHCYYCCKQFASTIQMIRECGDYHLRSNNYGQRKTFDRKNSLLVSLHDFDFLNQIEANFFFSHTCENQRIICDTCKKDFTSTEFIELHYKKKHFDELIKYDDIVLKNERWMSFCRNIDTQAIMYVAGMEDWYIPKYAMELNINYTNGNHVSYDMGHIFSGEINLLK